MRNCLKPAIGTLVLLLLLLPSASSAENPQVIVDLDHGTVSPENPTLNIKAIKSLSINLINGPVKPAPSSMLGMPTYERSADNSLRPHRRSVSGYSLTLMLKPCSAAPDDAVDLPCPFAVVYPEGPTWMVFSDEEIVPAKVAWKANGMPREVAVNVRLAKRRYALDWSVGFSFFEARDREFRIDPIPGDPEHAMFTRVSDAGYPYKLGAFAHYSSVRHPALAISAGFAFDVPVDTLTSSRGF